MSSNEIPLQKPSQLIITIYSRIVVLMMIIVI